MLCMPKVPQKNRSKTFRAIADCFGHKFACAALSSNSFSRSLFVALSVSFSVALSIAFFNARSWLRLSVFWCAGLLFCTVLAFPLSVNADSALGLELDSKGLGSKGLDAEVSGTSSEVRELVEFNALYAALLADYVEPGEKNGVQVNLVNFGAVKKDPRLSLLMDKLEAYDLSVLGTKEAKVAFYLNAYNIMAMNKVAENWPLKSLRGLGNMFQPVWTHQCGTIAGKSMTLRVLEHDILRQLEEPRIHFALNCASVSCPDLRIEPYEASKLEAQLDDQVAKFFSQQGKGFKVSGNKLWLTPLLDWFADDFVDLGGAMAFAEPYLPTPSDGERWQLQGYLEYDWSVNCHLSASELTRLKRKSSSLR